ncbi:type II toxin-antitoxin system VapC family toxin [Ornithinimicrobium sp. W1679]|uniref:type II toxin-antitoxin system VapC family toxin n=1 Tax=Ornithinimicrobium sp. W1679 TaxID=3418770 RepID=UPI003CE88841
MIVDTSVWIEYLRPGPSAAGDHLESAIRRRTRLVVPETVVMELLSGTTDELVAARGLRMLESFEVVPLAPLVDSLAAARLQRECRRAGESVRNLGDCLIAAVSLRIGVPVLHRDRDFEVMGRHCGLRTVSLLDER